MWLNIRIAGLRAAIAGLFCAGALSTTVRAADPPIVWLTGEKLRQQLDQKVSITWSARSGIPFRQALTHLSQAQQVAILVDRRVDPDQKIELTSDDATLDATFKLIASKLSIGEAQVGSVIYFGPEATARRVRTVSVLRHGEVIAAAVGASIAVFAIAALEMGRSFHAERFARRAGEAMQNRNQRARHASRTISGPPTICRR